MKFVIVSNEHDAAGRELRDALVKALTDPLTRAEHYQSLMARKVIDTPPVAIDFEVHVVDFMAVRDILPISVVPTVLVELGDVQGIGWPPERVLALIEHMKQYKPGVGNRP